MRVDGWQPARQLACDVCMHFILSNPTDTHQHLRLQRCWWTPPALTACVRDVCLRDPLYQALIEISTRKQQAAATRTSRASADMLSCLGLPGVLTLALGTSTAAGV